jgi:hypothetical protein
MVKVPTVKIRQLKTIASQSTKNSNGGYKKIQNVHCERTM